MKKAGRRVFGKITDAPENFPFKFTYGGKTYHGFEGLSARRMTVGGAGFQRVILTAQIGNLLVKADAKLVTEFGQVEYTVYFENHSDKPTEVLSDVYAKTVAEFIFLGSKITAEGDCSHEIKRHLPLGRKVMTNLDSVFKSRDIANKGLSSQAYGFSSGHVWM